jgi:hypothetical protein
VARALVDGRGVDAISACEAGRLLTESRPEVASFWIKFTHNLGLACTMDGARDLVRARYLFESVLGHPHADSRDIALAQHQMGLLLIDEVDLSPDGMPINEMRAKFLDAESFFRRSARALPKLSCPIIGIIELADKSIDLLADKDYAVRLLKLAHHLLASMTPEDRDQALKDYKGERALRLWFPALSRRKALIRKYLPWLLAILLMIVTLAAARPADARQNAINNSSAYISEQAE